MDKFLIAPFDSGLDKSAAPFLTPEDSFQRMNNAYLYRGRVRKRFGSRYMGSDSLKTRFRVNLSYLGAGKGITDNAGNAVVALPDKVPGIKYKVGQQFSIGAQIFTVHELVTPPSAVAVTMLSTGAGVGIYTTTGANAGIFSFAGCDALTNIFFYPAEPVMGLDNWENGPVNDHPAFGFDTQFAYRFSGDAWDISPGSPAFKGNDSDFFWVANWRGATSDTSLMFATNFNATATASLNDDDMWYWDGATWANFSALTLFSAGTNYVKTARCIVPFQGYLLLLNIIENNGAAAPGVNTVHSNRCRFSWRGTPLDPAQSWKQVHVAGYGGAGFVDATTQEAIIGTEFIKDHLIVYFERSTWELVYTGNAADPFIFQKLNSELGTQSTFSTVVFDKVILSIGSSGVCACNGSNIDRIDDKIPNDIFDIRTANKGIKRIAGIRDYQTEVVYWSWPIDTQGTLANTYPAKILVYNYKNGTWAYNDDVVTAWGYFEQDTADIWAGDMQSWEDDDSAWNAGVIQAQNRRIAAGNQQGFTFIVDADLTSNASVMQVTNATYAAPLLTLKIIDHTLTEGDFINLSDMNGLTIEPAVGTSTPVTGIYQVYQVDTDKDTLTINLPAALYLVAGAYIGGGLASRVSKVDIVSKQWNPYLKDASNFQLAKIDFCVEATSSGEITVDFSPNSALNVAETDGLSMIADGIATNSILGTSILETSPFTLYPIESFQKRLWHPIYFQTQGDSIQIRLYFSDEQMVDPEISQEVGFTLEGIMLYTKSTGRLE